MSKKDFEKVKDLKQQIVKLKTFVDFLDYMTTLRKIKEVNDKHD